MAKFKLKDFAKDISVAIKDAQSSPLKRFVGLEHYDSGEPVITRFTDTSLITSSVKEFKENDILIARRNVYLRRAGIVFFSGLTSGDSIILRIYDDCEEKTGIPKEDAIKILPFILNSNDFWNYANKHADGMNSKRISKDMLYDYEFDLPSLTEQRVIADKLWAAYRLKESYKKLLVATRDMVKSQFIEMFDCYADRVALSSLCDTFIDGNWIEAKDQSDTGIRLIQTGNVGVGTFKDKDDKARYISEETFNRLNCTEVVEGDILISRLPDPVGRACIIPAGLGKSITAVDCTIIRLNDKVLPKFFVAFTNTPDYAMQIKKVLSGTTRLRVSRANLGKIQIPLPSIDKQQQFVTIADQADKSEFDSLRSEYELKLSFPEGDNIPQVWVSMIAGGDQNLAKQYLNDYVHKLGNLTITGYNSTLSNNSFENKRDRQDKKTHRYIGYRNGLDINKEIAQKETWTIDDITNRTDELVKELLKMYKFPE